MNLNQSASTENAISIYGKKETILIVDDVETNIDILLHFLEPMYEIMAATEGAVALKLAHSEHPDLILLDIMMPEMDGFEVARRLKANPITEHIPIIFLTAKTDSASIVEGFQIGGADYVSKPFLSEELLARVQTQLRTRRYQKNLNRLLDERSFQLNKTKKDLERMMLKSAETSTIQDDIIQTVSHTLRTPLTSIFGYAEILSDMLSDDELKGFAENILAEAENLSSLIDTIIDFACFSQNNAELRIAPTHLSEVINQARSKVDGILSVREGVVFIDETTDVQFEVDKNRLVQVLINLMENAIRYSPDNGTIRIHSALEGRMLRVTIEDQGPGVPEPDLQRIFDKFYLVKRDSETVETIGLGLPISAKIIEAHHGSIWAEHSPHGGIFCFKLPLRQ